MTSNSVTFQDGMTKELCIGAYFRQVVRLSKKPGMLFTALYLKKCASCLQQAYGGKTYKPGLLPVPVSLTKYYGYQIV